MEKFKRSRRCRASSASRRSYHTVFGRSYRVIKIQNNKAHSSARSPPRSFRRSIDRQQLQHATRRPGGTLRASSVSRSFDGVQALGGVTLELAPRRGRRADRAERRGQVDARQRPQRLRPARRRARSSSTGRDVTRWSPHRRGRHGLARTFQHSHALSRPDGARERRGRGARRRRARAKAATPRADALLDAARARALRRGAAADARARRRAPARRRARARDGAALRADGRAGRGAAGGGGAGFRGRRPLDRATTTARACC